MARIVIVGGGMGGASLALLLAQKTAHHIMLIEQATLAADTFPDTPSYDARSTALALGSAEILDGIGVWRTLRAYAAPIRHINISHQGRFGAARLDACEERVAALGFVAENRHLGFALLEALHSTRVEVRSPMYITSMVRSTPADSAHPEWQLTLADDNVVTADLLVIADGVQSGTRAALGVGVSEHDYGAAAVVCNVTPREPHGDVAYERFTADGAVAILPLTGNRCAIVWSLPAARAREMLATDEISFLVALSDATGNRLGGFSKAGARTSYPLVKVTAGEQVIPGAVLLGNAAHLLHPVAGQGFNLTLRDAVVLSDTLAQADTAGERTDDLAVLMRYAQQRAQDQQLTSALSHGLPSLFGSALPLLAGARDVGLLAFDIVAPLKREFARQAMGIGVFAGGTSRAPL